MDTLALLGSALGLSVASGLSLYGTAFVAGLAIRLGWLHLPPGGDALAVLADPVVLTVAGILFAIEFLADKVPWLDSAWDAVHTLIRPIGGALLASRVFGELSPATEVVALLLLGSVTLATHGAKASARLTVNASPEPFSNLLLSLSENGLVAAGVWLALAHPLVALAAGLVVLVLAVTTVAWLGRRAVRVLRARRRVLASRADG
ncbi:MAG TPA: DUF4126 domain-containing protein [Methylomirabilota bacterium]|jgi:hypothetical protein|nr:DUF4126 domain-containing protein [Methylomirabilota bacterium]